MFCSRIFRIGDRTFGDLVVDLPIRGQFKSHFQLPISAAWIIPHDVLWDTEFANACKHRLQFLEASRKDVHEELTSESILNESTTWQSHLYC